MTRHRITLAQRLFSQCLVTLALLVKLLIPAGFMVDGQRPAHTLMPITLCTGNGPVAGWIGQDGAFTTDLAKAKPHPTDHSKTAHNQPCAYAGHGIALGNDGLAMHVSTGISYPAARLPQTQPTAPGRGLAAPPPPARGPPLTA